MLGSMRVVLDLLFRTTGLQNVAQASSALTTVGKRADAASASLKSLAGAFTAIVVGQYIRRAIEGFVKPAADMEQALTRLKTITGANTADMARYEAAARRAAEVTKYGPVEATEALVILRQALGSTNSALQLLNPTLALAMASFGKMEPDTAARAVAEMSKSFGFSADQAVEAVNKIHAASIAGGAQIQDFAHILGFMGSAALRGEQSFDEMLQTFVIANRALPNARRAMTELLRVMADLGNPAKRASLEAIGVTVTDVFSGKIKPASEIFTQLAKSYSYNAVTVRNAINDAFGEAGAKPVLAILSQLTRGMEVSGKAGLRGAEIYQAFGKVLKGSGSSVDEALKTYSAMSSAALQRVKEAWENLKITIGRPLLELFGSLAQGLSVVFNTLRELLSLPGINQLVGGLVRITALVGGMWGLHAALHGVRRILSGVFREVGGLPGLARGLRQFSFSLGEIGRSFKGVRAEWQAQMLREGGSAAKYWAGSISAAGLIARGAFAGVGVAARAMGVAIKAALPGIGLIIAFLPELVAAAKWVVSKAVPIIRSSVGKAGAWLADTGAVRKTVGWISGAADKAMQMAKIPGTSLGAAASAMKAFTGVDLLEKIDTAQKSAAANMREMGKAAYDYMHIGSKEMEAVVDKIKKLTKWKPEPIRFGKLGEMYRSAAAATKGTKGEVYARSMGLLLEESRQIALKAERGEATGADLLKLQRNFGDFLTMGRYVSQLYGGVTQGQLKVAKSAAEQAIGASGEPARLAAESLLRGGGGQNLGSAAEGVVPGYIGATGGFMTSPEQLQNRDAVRRALERTGISAKLLSQFDSRWRQDAAAAPFSQEAYQRVTTMQSPTLESKIQTLIDVVQDGLRIKDLDITDPLMLGVTSLLNR